MADWRFLKIGWIIGRSNNRFISNAVSVVCLWSGNQVSNYRDLTLEKQQLYPKTNSTNCRNKLINSHNVPSSSSGTFLTKFRENLEERLRLRACLVPRWTSHNPSVLETKLALTPGAECHCDFALPCVRARLVMWENIACGSQRF